MVVYLFLTLFSGFFASRHGCCSPRGISWNIEHILLKQITIKMLKCKWYNTEVTLVKRNYLTLYSLLKPAFSLADMFAIWALMFLTGMFLFVGEPLLLLSGKVGVESSASSASSLCVLSSVIIRFQIYIHT